MSWRILNVTGNIVETHQGPREAERALMILSAHDVKNGHVADYRIEPQIFIPSTLGELNLPEWVKAVFES